MAATPTIDQAKLDAFMGQFVNDLGAAATAPLVVLGDKLGLYRRWPAGAGDAGRARRADRLPRALYPRVALRSRPRRATSNTPAAAFRLPPEQELALAVEDSPAFIAGRLSSSSPR